ncbi:MAG: response regulator transcription factor, partial [Deltaproteobacteria bacterium]
MRRAARHRRGASHPARPCRGARLAFRARSSLRHRHPPLRAGDRDQRRPPCIREQPLVRARAAQRHARAARPRRRRRSTRAADGKRAAGNAGAGGGGRRHADRRLRSRFRRARERAAAERFVIRVAIVENETLVREGLRRVLELDGGLSVEDEARDGAEAVEMLRRSRPDVALLDVRMPRADGIAVLRELGADANPIRCIVLTTFDDADAFLAALRAGARGYLLKDASPKELAEAIRAVA